MSALTGRVRTALSDRLSGNGLLVAVVIVCLLASVLGLAAVEQSPDKILWTGNRVVGREEGGIVLYRYNGADTNLAVPGHASKAHYTLYVDKSDPDNVIPDSRTDRVIQAGFTLGPLLVAVLIISATLLTRRRQTRRLTESRDGYGQGINDDLVRRLLAERRQRPS